MFHPSECYLASSRELIPKCCGPYVALKNSFKQRLDIDIFSKANCTHEFQAIRERSLVILKHEISFKHISSSHRQRQSCWCSDAHGDEFESNLIYADFLPVILIPGMWHASYAYKLKKNHLVSYNTLFWIMKFKKKSVHYSCSGFYPSNWIRLLLYTFLVQLFE